MIRFTLTVVTAFALLACGELQERPKPKTAIQAVTAAGMVGSYRGTVVDPKDEIKKELQVEGLAFDIVLEENGRATYTEYHDKKGEVGELPCNGKYVLVGGVVKITVDCNGADQRYEIDVSATTQPELIQGKQLDVKQMSREGKVEKTTPFLIKKNAPK